MKLPRPLSTILAAALALAASPSAYPGNNPPIYTITKTAVYAQRSASGPVASGYTPYEFAMQAPKAITLGVPGGATEPIDFNADNGNYETDLFFGSKAGLDGVFPDGSYTMKGSGIPTLTFPVTPDSYPTAIPAVVGGTNISWSGGVLVINPAASATLNLSKFTTYATAGKAGHMELDINGQGTQSNIPNDSILSVSNPFGLTVQASPFTSYTLQPGTLVPGGIYEVDLQFETALKFDTSSVQGSGIISLFQNQLVFYVVSPKGGVAISPPVLTTNLSNKSAYATGSVTFAPVVTVGGSPITGNYFAGWYVDGEKINPDGSKYVSDGTSLTINSLTADDAGQYFAKFVNLGGLTTTS